MFYRYCYSFIGHLAIPFVLLRLLIKSVKVPQYRQRWKERFGFFQENPPSNGIWIHAVSFGEVAAALPLIKALKKTYPSLALTITTTTPTGSNLIRSNFSEGLFHVYAPYDLPWAVSKFLKRIRPKLAIFIETEIWPTIIEQCLQKNIPVLLTNARLSARSAKNYAKFYCFFKKVFPRIFVSAQTKADAKRFICLGVPKHSIYVTGSLKYDLVLPNNISEKANYFFSFMKKRKIWIVASTHEGEEEIIFKLYGEILRLHPEVLLILVPRHPERCSKLMVLGKKFHLNILYRTDIERIDKNTQVLLVNTMGELLSFYAVADVVMIGGSFIPHGGHNPLEAAIFSKPILSGPYVFNFAEVYRLLKKANAAQLVDEKILVEEVSRLFSHSDLRITMGNNAKKVLENNRGAIEKQVKVIESLLT